MSWYRDPELFLGYQANGQMGLWELRKKFGSPLTSGDFRQIRSNVTDHLSLIDNAFRWVRSDFDALAAFIYRHDLLVNCQGLSIPITFPRDRAINNQPNTNRGVYFWSHELVNLPRYGVPVHSVRFQEVRFMEGGGSAPVEPSPKENDLAAKLAACIRERDRERAEKQALQKSNSDLHVTIATLKDDLLRDKDDKKRITNDRDRLEADKKAVDERVSNLEAVNATHENELEKEKAYKIDLEKQVFDLTSKLKECCSVGDWPWMSGCTVPSTWAPFDDLDVLKFLRNTPVTISKGSSTGSFGEDNMTNVQASNFYQGTLTGHVVPSVVLVNFAELTPDNEKARFDPSVWGLFTNGDTSYAARQLN